MMEMTKEMFGRIQLAWAIGIFPMAFFMLWLFRSQAACLAFAAIATITYPNIWATVLNRPDLLETDDDLLRRKQLYVDQENDL